MDRKKRCTTRGKNWGGRGTRFIHGQFGIQQRGGAEVPGLSISGVKNVSDSESFDDSPHQLSRLGSTHVGSSLTRYPCMTIPGYRVVITIALCEMVRWRWAKVRIRVRCRSKISYLARGGGNISACAVFFPLCRGSRLLGEGYARPVAGCVAVVF
ncbi:hypothetical protein B0F90DRAFT_1092065 [Multifurca ochricompacta]|uniref:Uncharacterized protein n=1 Tax=Multifurca ochricompacta TaxID=376703 RepID=A0AAD4M9C7_9AGAM|nr:hypothetical protein B0F90DRAFT_1092065 [Multifurca ochricompacta]